MVKRLYSYISILLPSIFLLQLLLPVFIFCAILYVKESQENILTEKSYSQNELMQFSFSLKDYKNLKFTDDKELNIDDELYDIASIETKGDIVILSVMKDKEETSLQRLNEKSFVRYISDLTIKFNFCFFMFYQDVDKLLIYSVDTVFVYSEILDGNTLCITRRIFIPPPQV